MPATRVLLPITQGHHATYIPRWCRELLQAQPHAIASRCSVPLRSSRHQQLPRPLPAQHTQSRSVMVTARLARRPPAPLLLHRYSCITSMLCGMFACICFVFMACFVDARCWASTSNGGTSPATTGESRSSFRSPRRTTNLSACVWCPVMMHYCPTRAFDAYHTSTPPPLRLGTLPFFRASASRSTPLTYASALSTFKQRMRDVLHTNNEHYGWHSFRRGGTTAMFHAGVPDSLIALQGRWASLTYRRYFDNAQHHTMATSMLLHATAPCSR